MSIPGSVSEVPQLSADWDDATRESQSPRITRLFYNATATTITDGNLVTLDITTDTNKIGSAIIDTSTTADDPLGVGIADEDIPAGKWGNVVVYGYKADANVATSTAAGVGLQHGTTAGRAIAAATTDRRIGTCLTLAADNKADVFVGN